MAKQEAVSSVLAKINSRIQEAFNKHKNDQTEFGQVELPAGIRGGIAEVTSITVGVFREGTKLAGEAYWMASAVVREPKSHTHNGRKYKTEGGRTSIGPEPLCDTPDRQSRQSLDEHMAWILNEMRKMGLNTAALPKVINLEAICKAMVNPKKPIYIHFDTFGGPTDEDPNGRVNHKWLGPADPGEISPAEGGVSEGGQGVLPKPQANGSPTNGTPARAGQRPATPTRKPTPAPAPEPESDGSDDFTDTGDVFSLAEAADGGDKDAANTLADQASAMGFSEEQVAEAPSWQRLAEAMTSGQEPSEIMWDEAGRDVEPAPGEDEGQPVPQVDELYLYKPLDPKTKKPVPKALEVIVTAVDEENQLVNLKNNNNPKLRYLKVAFSDLIQSS